MSIITCPKCISKSYNTVQGNCNVCGYVASYLDSKPEAPDMVNHPAHYGGEHAQFEPIKVIKGYGWLEGFCLGSALKYIARAGKKDLNKKVEDLRKAAWYISYLADDIEKND